MKKTKVDQGRKMKEAGWMDGRGRKKKKENQVKKDGRGSYLPSMKDRKDGEKLKETKVG